MQCNYSVEKFPVYSDCIRISCEFTVEKVVASLMQSLCVERLQHIEMLSVDFAILATWVVDLLVKNIKSNNLQNSLGLQLTTGTKRKSQIQTFLEHNEGPGLQHLALVSEDIFKTLREMGKRSRVGGFEFMPSPPSTYYKNLRQRASDVLTEEQMKECEKLGILVDRDDQGTLLQIFTKPVGDRPTIFLEIIQRIGCMTKDEEGMTYQKGGCGGFGKGNFSELFKSIEDYEKTLEAKFKVDPAAA